MTISIKSAISDFFTTPKWINTLLFGALATLIPIVGPMVLEGYYTRRLARVRSGLQAQDFDFNDFESYLKLGLWPFLVSMVVSLLVIPLMFVAYLPMIAGVVSENQNIMVISMFVAFAAIMVVTFIMIIMMAPCLLRSALTSNFKEGFKWSFIKDFLKRVGGPLVIAMLLFGVVSIALSFLGMLACFIGIYFVSPLIYFGYFHLLFQLYDLYLERGGEEIPMAADVLGNAEAPPSLPSELAE